jgi:CxxC-x17-CxxC domain-containing protein
VTRDNLSVAVVPFWSFSYVTVSSEPRLLICVDCQKPFSFSEDEQRFYQQRGFRVPVRCLDCRAARRASRNADLIRNAEPESSWTETLGHYGGVTSNSRNGNGLRRNGGGFPAICAACGKETVVPFEPRSGRPVYCRDCFTATKKAR